MKRCQKTLVLSGAFEQPCIAGNEHCCIMVHVDDVMFCGDGAYLDVFLTGLKQRYSISHSQLEGVDSESQFLKRTLRRVPNGLALLPSTSIAKVIHGFETYLLWKSTSANNSL